MQNKFRNYLEAVNVPGSGKASSYIKALDYLSLMLMHKPLGFSDCQDIWSVSSIDRLNGLYDAVNDQKHLGDYSIWLIKDVPPSYLKNGYCTAAIRAYQEFLLQHDYVTDMMDRYRKFRGEAQELPARLQRDLDIPKSLLDNWQNKEGKETLRTIKARFNQGVFREITLENYQCACCITGNPISQLLTASHIKPWAASKSQEKLNPANGLCLAKTQDAAFDKGLITLDEDLKVVVSKSIRDHMTSQTIEENFLKHEGKKITLPARFVPSQVFLEYHRQHIFVA